MDWHWPLLSFFGSALGFYMLLFRNPDFKFGADDKQDWYVISAWYAALNLIPFLLVCNFILSTEFRDKCKNSLLLNASLNYLFLAFPAIIDHLGDYPEFHIIVKDVKQHNSMKMYELFATCSFAISSWGLSKTYDLSFESGFFSICLEHALKISLEIVEENGKQRNVIFIIGTYGFCFLVIVLRHYLQRNQARDTASQRNGGSPDNTNTNDHNPNNSVDESPSSAFDTYYSLSRDSGSLSRRLAAVNQQNLPSDISAVNWDRSPGDIRVQDENSLGDIRQELWDSDDQNWENIPPKLYIDKSSSNSGDNEDGGEEEEAPYETKFEPKEGKDGVKEDDGTSASDDYAGKTTLLPKNSLKADDDDDFDHESFANFVRPDTSKGGSMDPDKYVKIKCIASGNPRESTIIKGVVCTKTLDHKRMTSQYKKPRLLLLGGSLEYPKVPNHLASFDALLQQENEHLRMIILKIEALRQNVLLVEKGVATLAREYLLAKEIPLELNVKRPILERIARCTGALITPSVDSLSTARLGHCELFHVDHVVEDHQTANQFDKKPSKTLMFFEGCPRRLGCTVLLKGTSFLADEGATLPKMRLKSMRDMATTDTDISVISNFLAPTMRSSESDATVRVKEMVDLGFKLEGLGSELEHLDDLSLASYTDTGNYRVVSAPSDACHVDLASNLTVDSGYCNQQYESEGVPSIVRDHLELGLEESVVHEEQQHGEIIESVEVEEIDESEFSSEYFLLLMVIGAYWCTFLAAVYQKALYVNRTGCCA